MTDTTERQWQMTRLRSGDYLLPSNDRTTLWRIHRYDERDGSLTTGDGRTINGTFWRLLRWRFPLNAVAYEDLDDEFHWAEVACLLPTRQAAIDEAMSR